MKKVLFIIGSLRAHSFNRQLAEKAVASFTEVEYKFLDYADLPFMNQDLEYPVPEPVQRVYPGVLKNLLDWLSRPTDPLDRKSPSVIRGKNVMISSVAGQSGGLNAQDSLKSLLHAVGAVLVSETGFAHALGKEEFMTDELQLTAEEKMSLAMEINNLILGLNGF